MIDGMGRAQAPRPVANFGETACRTGAAVPAGRVADTPAAGAAAQGPAISNLARIAGELAASPPVDAARVDALRTAIASGSYRPDPMRIAEKMMALESPGPTSKA
ncbi:MAG: flagellar biosynthesis anti-sigma factor FlgM [Sandarakinorhabdus sp.]|nr:flagellar biosynthesis anti-sigma factor FlgM [Sandarakinorhabdus sp.]